MPMKDPIFLALVGTLVLGSICWGLLERHRQYREALGGNSVYQVLQGLLSLQLFGVIAVVFWWYGWKIGLPGLVTTFVIAALFRPREILESSEVFKKRVDRSDQRAIEEALSNSTVQTTLSEIDIDGDHLAFLLNRLHACGVETDRAYEGIRNPDIIRWYFGLPDPQKLTFDESLELINWVRYGVRP